jgi:uncharacterized protein
MIPGAAFQPPPDAAGTLYEGEVMHARLKPFTHRFAYRVFSTLIDIDRLDELDRQSPLFSVNRFNIMSFCEKDHIDARISPPDAGLRAYVNRLLETAGVPPPRRALLLAFPRVFGHAFNPISVYYLYDAANQLSALIYEVRNTFGERHSYVCPVRPGEGSEAGVRQSCAKRLHVSPFIGMNGRYEFRLAPPGGKLRLRILEYDQTGPLLAAGFSAKALPLNTANLFSALLRVPLLGLKVVALIHFEALRLWLKGAIFHRSPPPPPPAGVSADRAFHAAGEQDV